MTVIRQVLQIPFFCLSRFIKYTRLQIDTGWMPQTLKDQTYESPGAVFLQLEH